jgi:hypothetical protein
MPQHLGQRTPKTSIPGPPEPQGEPLRVGLALQGGTPDSAAPRAAGRAPDRDLGAPFPCPLQSNNSNENTVAFPASAARTAHALRVNVQSCVAKWGIDSTGFLTLTFADHVTCPKEAQRRMNSLTTAVLRPRYGGAIRVMERQESGRIHYHLLIDVGADIRTGCDFGAIKKQDYRSASLALRSEWAFWRRTAKLYGFGRTELLPVISTAEAVGRYVGKYISKHLSVREKRDLGVRLVSYIGPRVATVKFAWAEGNGRRWRQGLEALVRNLSAAGQIDSADCEAMRRRYGASWAWSWKDSIARFASVVGFDTSTGEIYAE